MLEVDNVVDVGSPPCVNGLVVVSNREKRGRTLMQQPDQVPPGRDLRPDTRPP